MASGTPIPVTVGNAFEKGVFFLLEPSFRGRGRFAGIEIVNEAALAPFWRNVPSGAACPVTDTWQGTSGRKAATMARSASRPRDREGPDTCAS